MITENDLSSLIILRDIIRLHTNIILKGINGKKGNIHEHISMIIAMARIYYVGEYFDRLRTESH